MDTLLTEELLRLRHRVLDFAADQRFFSEDLSASMSFPHEIWEEMGRQGFHGIGIPREHGGSGLGYSGMVVAGMALVEAGHCLGLSLSWLMNQVIGLSLLVRFGTRVQQARFLRALARGDLIGALAVSEPGHGAHPKYLGTAARRAGKSYMLTGKKTYITNGPVAGFFIVLAVTGSSRGKKEFTAFIVPRETPGLKIEAPMDLGFLKSCPHGEIILDGCRIPKDAVLGTIGDAYQSLVLPLREIEDALMMGPVIGAIRAQRSIIRELLCIDKAEVSRVQRDRLGKIQALLYTLELIALEATRELDVTGNAPGLTELIISYRHLAAEITAELDRVLTTADINPPETYADLASDLNCSTAIAAQVLGIRQRNLGTALLEGKSLS